MVKYPRKLNPNHRRLTKWLNYQLSASLLLFLVIFTDWAILLISMTALILTPVMVMILSEEGKTGWITFFGIFVIIPSLLIFLFTQGSSWDRVFHSIPIVLFLFYCFLLKTSIPSWEA